MQGFSHAAVFVEENLTMLLHPIQNLKTDHIIGSRFRSISATFGETFEIGFKCKSFCNYITV